MRIFAPLVLLGFVEVNLSRSPTQPDAKVGRCLNKLTGEEYREAETWSEGPCVSCICQKGGPMCASYSCAIPLCDVGYKAATLLGQCCPSCVLSCTDELGREYSEGDSWSPDPCTTCTCYLNKQGRKAEACAVVDCLPITTCSTRIGRREGECCPVCVEKPPLDCSTVKCAAPDCDTPVYSSGRCCGTCPTLPQKCALVDCMVVDADCEHVYLPDQPCCPICSKPDCPNGNRLEKCLKDPCTMTKCPNYPQAKCKADYCGGCNAVFYDPNGDVITNCEGDCPAPQIFKECGMACTPTCSNPLPVCTKRCVRRCGCPVTAPFLYRQTCFPEEKCPNYPTDCDTVEVVDVEANSGFIGAVSLDSGVTEEDSPPIDSSNVEAEVGAPVCEPVNCLADPCKVNRCANFPHAKCKPDYCGGCNAVFYDDNGAIISNCEGQCPATQQFRECGSACTPTCSNPAPICTEQCVRRCECPSDARILYKQTCIPANECPTVTGIGGSSTDGASSGSSRSSSGCRPKQPNPLQPPNVDPVPECDNLVTCFADPCSVNTCPNYPLAKCRSNYCGGCNAQFFDINGDLLTDCEGTCAAPKEYRECGSACPQTCRTSPSNCVAVCTPGCSCPGSAPVNYKGTCVTRDRCPDRSSSGGFGDEVMGGLGAPESVATLDSDTIQGDGSTSCVSVTLTLLALQAAVLFIFT